MAVNHSLAVSVLLSYLVATCYGRVSFSSLQKTLIVTASPQPGQGNRLRLLYTVCVITSWTVQDDVPTATYFIRAYVHNSSDEEVAFGQTIDSQKTINLLEIRAISGQHVSLDIAAVCFSVFSALSLFGFIFMEKRKGKAS